MAEQTIAPRSGAQLTRTQRLMGPLLVLAVALGLLGLPAAVWFDLRELSERMLRMQAGEISRVIDDMRRFYGSDVVGRVLQADKAVTAAHNYRDLPGAIPIPATLSIELGKRILARASVLPTPWPRSMRGASGPARPEAWSGEGDPVRITLQPPRLMEWHRRQRRH